MSIKITLLLNYKKMYIIYNKYKVIVKEILVVIQIFYY